MFVYRVSTVIPTNRFRTMFCTEVRPLEGDVKLPVLGDGKSRRIVLVVVVYDHTTTRVVLESCTKFVDLRT